MRLTTISWSSVIVGSIASILVYLVFNLIWVAFGLEMPLVDLIRGATNPNDLSFHVGNALLLAFTIAASLLIGAFAAGRTLPLIASRGGTGHGLMVAAIFFLLLPIPAVMQSPAAGQFFQGRPFQQAGTATTDGVGLGSFLGVLISQTQASEQSPEIGTAVSQVLVGVPYRQNIQMITGRVLALLRQSDLLGVRAFLTGQGLSPDQAEQRAQAAQTVYQQRLQIVQARARGPVSAAGWTLLMIIFLGAGTSVLGAVLGARTAEVIEELEREEVSRAA